MSTFMIEAGRKRRATVTVEEGPGAEILTDARKYLPAFSDAHVIFRAPITGNDANSGLTEALPKKTQSSAETAAGTTRKIRIIEDCTINDTINKPTEVKRGVSVSLQSPLSTIVDTWSAVATPSFAAGDEVSDATWSKFLKKFIAVGGQATTQKIAHSADGDTFTQYTPATPNAGVGTCVLSDETAGKIYVGTSLGRILVSTDGIAYTTITPDNARTVRGFARDESTGVIVAACDQGTIYRSTDNGASWQAFQIAGTGVDFKGIAWSRKLKRFAMSAVDSSGFPSLGQLWYSDEGYTWAIGTGHTTNSVVFGRMLWSDIQGKFIVRGTNAIQKFVTSADGATWADAATATANIQGILFELSETGAILVSYSTGQKLRYSYDADTSTDVTTGSAFGGGIAQGGAYSPLLNRAVVVGSAGTVLKSATYTTQVLADIAGMDVRAVLYGSGVKLYNCTTRFLLGSGSGTGTVSCIVKDGGQISANVQMHYASRFQGDVEIIAAPVAAGDVRIENSLFAKDLTVTNSSGTYNELIREIIALGKIRAAYPIVAGGCIRGTATNVVYDNNVIVPDPKFVDETDYLLQREVEGYEDNSPLVERSAYYLNSVGKRRDIGPWGIKETNETYIYQRAYEMRKPSAKDATSHTEKQPEYLYWGEDMTPDVATDPEARGEELTLNYRTLPIADVEFFRYLRSLKDRTVRIDYDPSWTPAATVTVDGNQSAGEDVLVLQTSSLETGQKLTISGKTYYVIRMNGTTKAVLDKPLKDAVTNGQVITVSDTLGKGTYQFTTNTDIDLTRFYENNKSYLKGVKMKFVRKGV